MAGDEKTFNKGVQSSNKHLTPLPDESLAAIAFYQQILSALVNFSMCAVLVMFIFNSLARGAATVVLAGQLQQSPSPSPWPSIGESLLLLVIFGPGMLAAYPVGRIASLMRLNGWLRGVVTVVPVVGWLLIYAWNSRAIGALNGRGVRVGLLGARAQDLVALNTPLAAKA